MRWRTGRGPKAKPVRTVRLDPMSGDEYAAWEADVVSGYAEAQVKAGHWTPGQARDLALQETRNLLPAGPATPDHHLWIARDAENGTRVGALWLAIRRHPGRMDAFVYDVHIDPAQQGGGYGRAVMEAGAAAAKALGAQAVFLNVHGYNDRAYNLYKSLGYRVTNRHMRLAL